MLSLATMKDDESTHDLSHYSNGTNVKKRQFNDDYTKWTMLRRGKLTWVNGSSEDLYESGFTDEFGKPLGRYEVDRILPVTKPFLYVPAKYVIDGNPHAVSEILRAAGVPFNPPSMVINCCGVNTSLKKTIPPRDEHDKVFISKSDAQREDIEYGQVPKEIQFDVENSEIMSSSDSSVDMGEEKIVCGQNFEERSADGEFVIVDKNTLDKERSGIFKKLFYLMGAVLDTCIEAKSIISFDNPMNDNTLINIFPSDSQAGLLFGTTDMDWLASLNRKQQLRHRTVSISEDLVDVREVCLPRNEYVKNIPHEKISCLVIFESKTSEMTFAKLFKSEVFQGTLLVNGGCEAFDTAVRVMETGKPLFVFAGVGGSSDLFNSIYKQATDKKVKNKDWKLSKRDSYAIGLTWFAVDDGHKPMKGWTPEFKLKDWTTWEREPYMRYNGGEWRHDESKEPIEHWNPKVWKEKWRTVFPYEMILRAYGVLSHWPETFSKRNTLVIPTMNITPSQLTDQLTRVMASADEAKPELGGKRAEIELLMNGWAQRYLFEKGAQKSLKLSDFLNILIIVLTFLTYVCVVILNMDHFQSQTVAHYRSALVAIAVILPIMISLLFSLNSQWAPGTRWGMLTLAAKKTEAEIYRYRARVGPYAPRRRKITLEGGVSEGKTGGSASQKTVRVTLVDNLSDILTEMQSVEGSALIAVPSREHAATENGTFEDDEDIEIGMANASAKVITDGLWVRKWEDGVDNRVSKLRAQQFLDWRLIPELEKRRKEAPRWEFWLNVSQFTIFFCSSITAFLAAFDFTEYIAVVLAFAAGVSAFVELRQLKHRVRGMNLTISKLGKAHLWWQGLTLVQRRQQSARERLVNDVEQALIDEIATLTASAARLDRGEEIGNDDNVGAPNMKKK